MAGPDPDGLFDGDQFREDLRAAMLMATPNTVEEQVTFHFPRDIDHDQPADDGGQPWDFNQDEPPSKDDNTPDPQQVTCVVDWGNGTGVDANETRLGQFQKDRGELILFDEEWAQVSNFDHVTIGGDVYVRGKHDVVGLYDVDVHMVIITARAAR